MVMCCEHKKKLDINSTSLKNKMLLKILFKECLNFELEW